MHTRTTLILLTLLSLIMSFKALAEEKEKRYRVEVVLFQKTKTTPEAFLERGTPDLSDSLPFVSLPPSKFVLLNAKRQFSKQYTPILHEAWLQTLGTKDAPTKVRLVTEKKLDDGRDEIKGIFQIFPGRQLFLGADLAISHEGGTTRFETIVPITQDELNYISYANYAMIVLVGPAVTPRI